MTKIAIIGGSGLNKLSILEKPSIIKAHNVFGEPSSDISSGTIEGKEVLILARHGSEHTIPPSQVNYRANIRALKDAGCTHILSTTACGSLKEEYKMGDFVIPDQFIDFTKKRINTFYDKFKPGMPVHAPMADPFNEYLRNILINACEKTKAQYHKVGTVVTIEGPRFSTRAESHMYRILNGDIINMTVATECTLANELEIPYATIALVTDYDCWKEDEESVSWETVLSNFKKKLPVLTTVLSHAVKHL